MHATSNPLSASAEISLVLPYFERTHLLLQSLKVLNFLYSKENLEVIIVDDGSNSSKRPVFPEDWKIRTTLITILKKDGINPCLPINVGVRHSNATYLLLSSPEIIQTENLFNKLPLTIDISEVYVFPVFAITDPKINQIILNETEASSLIETIRGFEPSFHINLGKNGNLDQNNLGRWYCHRKYNPSNLNFLMLMTKENYFLHSGFDEKYRFGAGFDDYEFRRRLQSAGSSYHYFESSTAVHLDHEEVSSRAEFGVRLNSNEKLYRRSWYRYKQNDRWGTFAEIEVLRMNY
jgi:GT2 family glycosyltransferase